MELVQKSFIDKNIVSTSEWYITTENKKYIDFTLGLSCFTWGYNNKRLINALIRGIESGVNFTRGRENETCEILRKVNALILSTTQMKSVLWTGSGTDAVEAAIQISRQYHSKVKDDRVEILSLSNGYYGCSWLNKSLKGERELSGINTVPLPDWNTLDERQMLEEHTFNKIIEKINSNNKIGTIIFESTPFSIGVRPWSNWWWEKIKELQIQKDLIIILDDITGGFGKIAPFASHQRFNFSPDIITLGKGITGGYAPVSCALVGERIQPVIGKDSWTHGHTFQPFLAGLFLIEEIINMTNIENFTEKENKLTQFLDESITKNYIKYYKGLGLARELVFNKKIDADYLERLGVITAKKRADSILLVAPQNATDEYWADVEKKLSTISRIH